MNMWTIGLEGLEFYARHGVYAEEQTLGNRFTADIRVHFPAGNAPPQSLAETTDYGQLYALLKAQMETPTPLLETLCWTVATDVLRQHPQVQRVWVRIAKHNPSLGGLCEKSFNELTLHRDATLL